MIQGSSPLDIRRPQRRGGGAGSFAPPSLTLPYTTVCGVCLECLAVLHSLHDRTVALVGDAIARRSVRQKVRVTQLGHTDVTRVCESTHET